MLFFWQKIKLRFKKGLEEAALVPSLLPTAAVGLPQACVFPALLFVRLSSRALMVSLL